MKKHECRRTGYSYEPALRGMLSSSILHPLLLEKKDFGFEAEY